LLRAAVPLRGTRGQPSPTIKLVKGVACSVGVFINTDSKKAFVPGFVAAFPQFGAAREGKHTCFFRPPNHNKLSVETTGLL
jgi:hypothetical protein